MPRIVGVDIPKEKRVELSLTYVYGIGRAASNRILKVANINPDKRAKDLTEEEVDDALRKIKRGGIPGTHYRYWQTGIDLAEVCPNYRNE